MSLPLTRRIARAALLVAAGAAAGVGAAGSASAAPELPAAPNLGGLTALDGANVDNTVDSAAKAVPAAGKTSDKAVKKVSSDPVGSAQGVVGDTTKSAAKGGLPTDPLAKGGLQAPDRLPVKSLRLG
ncbi:ATP-binding protein [Streptomyces sp. NPDC050997]|uniref:ATP-binding protein n=1 Tax=Streptomyces sp. NPDC050997 TaxID=3155519 RepID=UPI003422C29C